MASDLFSFGLLWAFVAERGLLSSCGMQASQCGDVSGCGTQASVAVVYGSVVPQHVGFYFLDRIQPKTLGTSTWGILKF